MLKGKALTPSKHVKNDIYRIYKERNLDLNCFFYILNMVSGQLKKKLWGNMNRLLILSLTVFLTACSTKNVNFEDAVFVDNERNYSPNLPNEIKGNDSRLIVTRDSDFFGSACSLRIYINEFRLADLEPSKKVVLKLKENDYILTVGGNGKALCGSDNWDAYEISIDKGQTKKLRVGGDMNKGFYIRPTAF